MKEIERKYVAFVTAAFRATPPDKLLDVIQSYPIATKRFELRIRKTTYYIMDGKPVNDVRQHIAVKFGNGLIRTEFERRIPLWLYKLLFWTVRRDQVLVKRRTKIGPWEVDEFRGGYDGLMLAEFETTDPNAPEPETPPGLVLTHEVTYSQRFANKRLARNGKGVRAALILKVYTLLLDWVIQSPEAAA